MEKIGKKEGIDYRASHTSKDYGKRYEQTYLNGYYFYQWENIERSLISKQLHDFKKNGSNSLLDFACGTGRILKVCEEVFSESDGLDISESMLDIARTHCKKSNIQCIDITKQKLEKKYDIITAFRFFLNAEPKLRDEVLSEFHSILNDDGSLLFNIHTNKSSPLGIAYRVREFLTGNKTPTENIDTVSTFLEKNGFTIESVTRYGYLPRLGWRFNFIYKNFMNIVEKMGNKKLLPGEFSQCFLVVAKKQS